MQTNIHNRITINYDGFKNDKIISIALMSTFVVLTLQYCILAMFNLLDSPSEIYIKLTAKLIVATFYLLAFFTIIKKTICQIFTVYIFFIILFTFHYFIFTENKYFIQDLIFPFFCMSLPSLILSYNINNVNVFYKTSKMSSYIVFILIFILIIYCSLGFASIGEYSMSLSYYILFPTLFILLDTIKKFSIFNGILLLISLFIIISFGARGPLLCLFIFSIFVITKKTHKFTLIKIIIINFTLLCIFLFLIFYKYLLRYIYTYLLQFNINSRTLMILIDNGFNLTGREHIYQILLNKISEEPLFGIGLGGDRVYLDGVYAHNFFIEIIANFGIIISFVLIYYLFYLILKTILIKNIIKFDLFAIYFSLGFIPLLISASYIEYINFWIFMGILLNINYNKHINYLH